MAFITNPKIIVCLCVYTRLNNLKRWLKTWSLCQQYDAKLVVINNYDKNPDPQFQNACNLYPDIKCLATQNSGLDMGRFQDLCKGNLILGGLQDWEIVYWTADDCLPLKKTFLLNFLHVLMSPRVGIVTPHISEEMKRHVRTNCFCTTRDVCRNLKFPVERISTREECYKFEHLGDTLYDQVIRMGLKAEMPDGHNGNINHVTWDSGHYSHLNKWEEYWAEFPECREYGTHA